jgi:hypothetical protein
LSLGEAREIYNYLERINNLLDRAEAKTNKLKVEASHATGRLREMEYVLFRITSLLRRMGLSDEVNTAIQRLQNLILVIRMVHSALMYLEAGTPYGWIIGGVTLAASLFPLATSMEMRGHT